MVKVQRLSTLVCSTIITPYPCRITAEWQADFLCCDRRHTRDIFKGNGVRHTGGIVISPQPSE